MDLKQALLDSLAVISPRVDPVIERVIPAISKASAPPSSGHPNYNQELLAYNLNNILKEFEGLSPIECLLHAGQLNATFQGILISGLELAKEIVVSEFAIISPTDSGGYANDTEVNFEISITSGTAVNALLQIDDAPKTPLKYEGEKVWKRSIEVSGVGEHTASFTVTFEGAFAQTQTVTFLMDDR